MKLTLDQIKSITTGACRVEEIDGGIRFFRFTKEQELLYEKASEELGRGFYDRRLATAGVRLRFATDSKTLKLAGEEASCTSRMYYSFDVFVNGKPIGYIDNFSDVSLPVDYTEVRLLEGEFSKEFDLGDGHKEVCVYFPWSAYPTLREVSIDDGAFIKPIKPTKKLLAFGDSITQGYDALRPSKRYVSLVADELGFEEINKGIGGEIFFPPLAETKEDFTPDYITVAYGTNDWSTTSGENFKENCKAFYASLSKNYPTAKIFAICPIWRKNYKDEKPFGPFEKVEEIIREVVGELENVTVIPGFDLVPKDEKYFADLRLHPTASGFEHYAKNLCRELKDKI